MQSTMSHLSPAADAEVNCSWPFASLCNVAEAFHTTSRAEPPAPSVVKERLDRRLAKRKAAAAAVAAARHNLNLRRGGGGGGTTTIAAPSVAGVTPGCRSSSSYGADIAAMMWDLGRMSLASPEPAARPTPAQQRSSKLDRARRGARGAQENAAGKLRHVSFAAESAHQQLFPPEAADSDDGDL